MRFKYGSFFGLTAVHLMFMPKTYIDKLFSGIHLKNSVVALVNNLYSETYALKQIFSTDAGENPSIPHIVTSIDLDSKDTEDFLNGLNWYLYQKDGHSLNTVPPSNDDLDSLLSSESVSSDSTNVFGDLDSLLLDGEKQDSSDLDALVSDTSDDLDDLIGSDDSQGLDVSFLLDDNNAKESVIDVNNLAEYGRANGPCPEPKIKAPQGIVKYKMLHSKDFSKEESAAIDKQLLKLRKPSQCRLPASLTGSFNAISEQSLRILRVIYESANEVITEQTSRIDYVLQKLEALLNTASIQGKNLFFQAQGRFRDGDASWGLYNSILDRLCTSYLTGSNKKLLLTNINSLLDDCNLTMGITNQHEAELLDEIIDVYQSGNMQATVTYLLSLADIDELARINGESILRPFVTRIYHNDDLMGQLLKNIEGLRYVLNMYLVVYQTVMNNMLSKIDLGSQDTLEQATTFVQFAKETGICGLYLQFEDTFQTILKVIGSPLAGDNAVIFPRNSARYRFASLLKKHLQSLKSRIGE